MKPTINLSINPSYYCNFRCSFCYLTPEQLSDKRRLPLERLSERLDEIQAEYTIGMVDLYGGEVLLLPEWYLQELIALLRERGVTDINLVTNLSVRRALLDDPELMVSVSYDFAAREQHEKVFTHLLTLKRPFSILMLASPRLLAEDPDQLLQSLGLLSQLQSVEVKPYSPNQANAYPVSYRAYELFVQRLIESPIPRHFELVNETRLKEALSGARNAYSDDHLYLTPSGRYAVLEFDAQDREYFLELETLAEYRAWCVQEKARVQANAYCTRCRFLGRCLSEHLREVRNIDESCNGFIHLLSWYEART